VIVLRGGQSEKQRSDIAAHLAAIPQTEERVIVATGRYLGEGFDDSRLDTIFLTMPIAWKGTLAQYAGRLHRLHDAKREVIIYDYVYKVGPRWPGRHVRPAWANAQALPTILAAVPARFGRHPHWRESGAIQISAPFAGFLPVGHFAAHERKFSRHFKRIF
jgi:hypothetical protein